MNPVEPGFVRITVEAGGSGSAFTTIRLLDVLSPGFPDAINRLIAESYMANSIKRQAPV